LADLDRREIRALSIHSFTNQPVRLLRALRYAARMGFEMSARTAEWFKLAMERGLRDAILPQDAGSEFRQVVREERPAAVLKAWESFDLVSVLHPQLAKRHPDYEGISRITRVRDDMWSAGLRPRLFAPVALAVLGRLNPRESKAVLTRMELRAAELHLVDEFESDARNLVKTLAGPTTASPRDAYAFLERTRLDLLAYVLAESSNSKVVGKIRNYLYKWRQLRTSLPNVAGELEALGLEHGPKFDNVLENFFQAQLLGKARNPEAHLKVLRRLAGIKEPPKKVEEKKVEKTKKKGETGDTWGASNQRSAPPKGAPPAPPGSTGNRKEHKSKRVHAQAKTASKGHGRPRPHGKKK
jgi:tRNA nucleotidyltransferase/poly(A) polymerase